MLSINRGLVSCAIILAGSLACGSWATAAQPAGRLTIAASYMGSENLDPTRGPTSSKGHLRPIFDPLVGVDNSGRFSKTDSIAEVWEVSPDSTRTTFKIRRGINFHNGDEVTSSDVKFTIEYAMGAKSLDDGALALRDQKVIKSIETPDPYTLVVTTNTPYAYMVTNLSQLINTTALVLPKKYIEQNGLDNFARKPIGTGPYKFKEQKFGSYIEYEALPSHWRVGAPKYETLRMMLVPEETTRIAMLKTGQADVIDISRARVKELKDDFNIFYKVGGLIVGMWLNQTWEKDGYLSNPKVREALNLAVDRKAILDGIFDGQGRVTTSAIYGSMADGYKPLAPYPYDPVRAKQLLAEAYPQGIDLTLYAYTRPGASENVLVPEVVASMWAKIGVRSKVIPVEQAAYSKKWREFDLKNSASSMAYANRALWYVPWGIHLRSNGSLTLTRDPEMDKLVDIVLSEKNHARIGEAQQKVAEYVRANHYFVGLVEVSSPWAANKQKVGKWNMGIVANEINLDGLIRQ